MLTWVWIFLVVASIAGLFGFTNLEAEAVGIARIIFFIFIIAFAVLFLVHRFNRR